MGAPISPANAPTHKPANALTHISSRPIAFQDSPLVKEYVIGSGMEEDGNAKPGHGKFPVGPLYSLLHHRGMGPLEPSEHRKVGEFVPHLLPVFFLYV